MKNLFIYFFICSFLFSCSSLKVTELKKNNLEINDEYQKMISVKKNKDLENKSNISKKNIDQIVDLNRPKNKTLMKSKKKKRILRNKNRMKEKMKSIREIKSIEDEVGRNGRRPIVDPFRSGESVSLSLSYLGMDAGILKFETLDYAEVNDKKVYRFKVSIKSSPLFSLFYSLDNTAETYVDFVDLIPLSHEVHINESKQVKEARSFFDWKKLKAHYWEKRITKEDGEKNRKVEWDLKDFSQNVISTLFYIRIFSFEIGKDYSFYVADDGKIIKLKSKVLRTEVLDTKAGKIETIVIEPKLEVNGTFQQKGQILLWLTNDDRKLLVKLKSKIKIGSINGELSELIR